MRASEQRAAMIEHEVTEQLPISAELREMWLVVFEGQWSMQGRFELGAGH
jgi:hypothetical protein